MSTQSKLLVVTLLIALLAIPITLNLTDQQQDLRQQASENENFELRTTDYCDTFAEDCITVTESNVDSAYNTYYGQCLTKGYDGAEKVTCGNTLKVCCSTGDSIDQPPDDSTSSDQICTGDCLPETEAFATCDARDGVLDSSKNCGVGSVCCNYNDNAPPDDPPIGGDDPDDTPSDQPLLSHATYPQCTTFCSDNYTEQREIGNCIDSCRTEYACANYGQEATCLDQVALQNDVYCRSERYSGAYCPGANDICCVFEDVVPGEEDETQYCSDFYGTCTNSSCPDGTSRSDDKSCENDSNGSICCLSNGSGSPGAPGSPGLPPGGGDDNVGGDPPDDPNITCGDCNQSCSSGFGDCQTCTDSTTGQTFSQACSEDPDDSIYTESCGKGDYTDDTHTKRSGDPAPFTHVACTGDSVCDGGPNPDGTYWCIEKFPEQDGEVCKDGKHYDEVEEATCSTGCATYYTCPSGDDALGTCVDSSFCGGITQPGDDEEYPDCDVTSDLNQNGIKCPFDSSCSSKYRDENEICTNEPDDSDGSQNNYPYVTKINPSTNKTGTTSTPITLTITGDADRYTAYLHRGNPEKGDTVQQSYDPSSVPTTQFVILGSTTSNKFTFNSPTQVGTYKIAINASNNPSGNQGELVCAWHEEVFERASNGAIDINSPIADCDNGLINLTVEQSGGQQPQGNTSTTREGLTVTAKPSKNCGGHIEVTWTDIAGTPVSNGYWVYQGNSSSFTPSGTNLLDGGEDIPAPRNNPPYYHWLQDYFDGDINNQRYYYKVIASDNTNGNRESFAAWSNPSYACN